MRASATAEGFGIPTVSLVCEGFVGQAGFTAAGLGMPKLPLSAYPGPVNLHSDEEVMRNVVAHMIGQVVNGLTVQPEERLPSLEPEPRDVVFSGTFEEVNRFFYEKEWSDGLPIVPPTEVKVKEIMKYTDRPADQLIGVLSPDNREATVWNVAVNGVMAGCLPEYMPVLLAIVEAMADPTFGVEHLGNTPGTETLITLNGPVIKDLGFNYEQGALRVGFQANTSVGRFFRLYLRNVAGFLPHKTDKATFGGTWRAVLAENEDALAAIGWEPMSVDQGFQAGDNVVTLNSCTSTDSMFSAGADRAEDILDKIASRLVDIQLYLFHLAFGTAGASIRPSLRPQILLSPCLAEEIAKAGYSKKQAKQYLYEHARFQAGRFERLHPRRGSLYEGARQGRLPKLYGESRDPDRLLPLVWSPEDFLITVSGDPGRDNCLLCGQNGYIGYAVSKKIALPANWDELMKEARK